MGGRMSKMRFQWKIILGWRKGDYVLYTQYVLYAYNVHKLQNKMKLFLSERKEKKFTQQVSL